MHCFLHLLFQLVVVGKLVDGRFFLSMIPNGISVPCINAERGCYGTSVCEAWGHVDCLPGLPLNSFGRLYTEDVKSGLWESRKCNDDSDSDGYTNGDELGDPCCNWDITDSEGPKFAIATSPVHASSFPRDRATCGSVGAALPPSYVTISASSGSIIIVWPPAAAIANTTMAACVCGYTVTVSIGRYAGSAPLSLSYRVAETKAFDLLSTVVCLEGPPSDYVANISISAENRGGRGAATFQAMNVSYSVNSSGTGAKVLRYLGGLPDVSLLPHSSSLVGAFAARLASLSNASASSTSPCSSSATGTPFFDTAGRTLLPMTEPTVGLWVASFLWVAGVVCISLLLRSAAYRSVCLGMADGRRSKSSSGGASCSTIFRPCQGFASAFGGSLFALVSLGVLICAVVAYAWFSRESFSHGQGMPWNRALGYACVAALGLTLLPAAKYSLWTATLGVPFDRAISMHKWLGGLSVLAVSVHGIASLVVYSQSALRLSYTVEWLPLAAINPLAGVLGGGGLVLLALLSLPCVRRGAYNATLLAHATLVPLALLFTIMHTWGSRAPAVPLLAPAIALTFLDWLARAADALLWPVELVASGIISDVPQDASWPHRTAYLVCEKRPRWGCLAPCSRSFAASPGQYVYLYFTSLAAAVDSQRDGRSLFRRLTDPFIGHPFSVSSLHDPAHPGRFTLHIKSNGPLSWSGALVEAVWRSQQQQQQAGERMSGSSQQIQSPIALATALQTPPKPIVVSQSVHASLPYAIPGEVWPPRSPSSQHVRLPLFICGPFGAPSLDFTNYRHFILIAGGIGITPIAPLHQVLSRGRPYPWERTKAASAATLSRGLRCGEQGSFLGRLISLSSRCCRLRSIVDNHHRTVEGERVEAAAPPPAPNVHITTVWATRDRSLLQAFSPLFGEPVSDAPPSSGNPDDEAAAAAAAAVAASPPLSPASPNALQSGSRLAAARKWVSSFAITSSRIIQSKTTVNLNMFLTSGKKKSSAGATAPVAVAATATATATATMPVRLGDGATAFVMSPPTGSIVRAAATAIGANQDQQDTSPPSPPHLPAIVAANNPLRQAGITTANNPLRAVVRSSLRNLFEGDPKKQQELETHLARVATTLETINSDLGGDEEQPQLPIVSKDRPNLPSLLAEVCRDILAKARAANLVLVPPQPIPRVAVFVCGASAMVEEVLRAANHWNQLSEDESGGLLVDVHRETFLF